ncbi:hypothetical protein OHZ10_29120 [Burkholderia arboris]|uniref:Uncharacterized protein n=1 Tax=Burkholderia arboris TaxID=488730 RepID=A0ABZ3DN09_9BURK
MIFRWIRNFLNRPISTPEIASTYAYQAGFKAWENGDSHNPYKDGTESSTHWLLGYRDAEHCEATLW